MTTVALYNIKGGVGKTAGCVNLAYLAAEEGKKVLIWDLDPQGAATFYFQSEAGLKGNLKKLMSGEGDLTANIHPTEFENLSLVPADFSNRHLDAWLEELRQGKKKFRSMIGALQGSFDYLFLDCPPGIGALSEALFAASDVVLMPSIPTTLSLRTFDMVQSWLEAENHASTALLSYFSMVDIRKSMHQETLARYSRNKMFLKNYIPYLSTVEKMGTHLAPVAWFAPSSYAAQCYRNLWKEFKKKSGH